MKEYEQKMHNIINNAEEDVIFQAHQAYKQGYEDGKELLVNTYVMGKGGGILEAIKKAEYNRGLADMLEAVKSIRMMTADELEEIFGLRFVGDVLVNLSPSKIISKYHVFKAQIKELEDAEIKVGEEVYSEEDDLRFVVTRIMDGRYEGICTDGACYCPLPLDIKKTGRHAYRIIELLGELDETD